MGRRGRLDSGWMDGPLRGDWIRGTGEQENLNSVEGRLTWETLWDLQEEVSRRIWNIRNWNIKVVGERPA